MHTYVCREQIVMICARNHTTNRQVCVVRSRERRRAAGHDEARQGAKEIDQCCADTCEDPAARADAPLMMRMLPILVSSSSVLVSNSIYLMLRV